MILNRDCFNHQRVKRVCPASMLFVLVLSITADYAGAQALAEAADQRLRARISGFWQAMQDADYDKAMTFIDLDSRRAFNKLPKSRVSSFKIDKLTFDRDFTECATVTVVSKPMPAFGAVFDWPVQNQWILHDGEWYLKVPWGENENPMLLAFKQQRSMAELTKAAESPEPEPQPAKTATVLALAEASQRLVPDPANPTVAHFGEKVLFHYNFQNKTDKPIRIVSAYSDCHCTGVQSEYPEVPPGGNGSLEAILDSFGLPIGNIEKQISVQFSDLSFPLVVLLKVKNVPNFTIAPAAVEFGVIARGIRVEKSVRLVNESGKTVKIISKLKSDPRLEFSIDKGSLAPGEALTIQLRYDPATPGEFMDGLMLETDLPAEPLVSIPIRGTVKP
jgi:hypothetical protein